MGRHGLCFRGFGQFSEIGEHFRREFQLPFYRRDFVHSEHVGTIRRFFLCHDLSLRDKFTPIQEFCKFFAKRKRLAINGLQNRHRATFLQNRKRFVAFLQNRVKLGTMPRKPKHNPTISRGLTAADYHRLRRRILDGELTWQEAEKLGLCLPRHEKRKPLGIPRKPGRVASAPKGQP